MRFTLMPLLVPPSILGVFALGLHQFITNRLDRGLSLGLIIASVVAAGIASALHVYTVDNRIREQEARIDRLITRLSHAPNDSDAEQAVRTAFGLDR
ncbi:MAG: hypothetical protein JWN70_895 [Planctomycetaceae bacterium]|nr:hypothetical protein [Planctomycetaceae bacterium]